jgi:hypothetical protein
LLDGYNFFESHMFLAGDNTAEVDAIACRLLDIPQPDHVRLAREAGLFRDDVLLQGANPQTVRRLRRPENPAYKEFFGLRLWSNPTACSMCRYLFRSLRHELTDPRAVLASLKLVPHLVLGADIVFGRNPHFRRTKRRLIAVGDCTKPLADQEECLFVPGCPPSLDELRRCL